MSVLSDLFADIAAAIRSKNGEAGTMKPAQFPDKIAAIETGSTGGAEKPLLFATGEFQITAAEAKTITHNMGVTPDIVVYFLAKLDSTAMLTDSSGYYSGEVAYSSEAIADGAERKLYLLNGSNFTIARGIWGTDDEWDTMGCVRNANPESFEVGGESILYHCPNAVYRWAAIGNLKEHNDVVTARFYDGETLLKTETVEFGAAVTPPELTKDGYELSWSPANMTVKFDTDFMAVWTEIKKWATVALADYATDTSGTYEISVGSERYVKPYVQFTEGGTWGSTTYDALTEKHSVFDIGSIVEGKTSIAFTETVSWTGYSGSSSTTDDLSLYVHWFDKDGNFLLKNYGYTSGKFSGAGSRTVSKTYDIPDGAYYMGVCTRFGGYASSGTFSGVTATLKMVVS